MHTSLSETGGLVRRVCAAPRLISNLKKLGYKVGILSGGFTYFAHRLQKELGIDYVHANELDFVDGRLSGKVKGEIVDGERKVAPAPEPPAPEPLSPPPLLCLHAPGPCLLPAHCRQSPRRALAYTIAY
jgi:hypothetical protein